MDDHDRPIAEGLHRLVKEIAPDLNCRTWYGFPAYGVHRRHRWTTTLSPRRTWLNSHSMPA